MDKKNKDERIPYRDKLVKEARDRYYNKLCTIGNVDPYELKGDEWSSDVALLPPTTALDITNYLVFGISAYTSQQFKNYKSLEAYGHFTHGWVQDLFTFRTQDCNNTVVSAKVLHSQRLSETPLKAWAIIDSSGAISSAHCTCMAGVAETCTHVAALLFKLEAVVRCRETTAVTGQPAYWMIPSSITKVGAEAGHKIDYTTAKAKRKSFDKLLCGEEKKASLRTVKGSGTFSTATQEQWGLYLKQLQTVSPKAAMLSNVPAFCDAFTDPVKPFLAPAPLSKLRDYKMDGSDYSALRQHCNNLNGKSDISIEQAQFIEENSRLQHRSPAWRQFRIGRVTASNMHAVFVSKLDTPALSTVRAVCHQNKTLTQCAATAWGREQEERARMDYKLHIAKQHSSFNISQCGFVINPKFPEVGASPDGIVQCSCCGKGVLEIKCPYKYRDNTVLEACNSMDQSFCLEVVVGQLQLKKCHPHYKQVQTQIFVTDAQYCDFVVWTMKDCVVMRVMPDPQLWHVLLSKAQEFFKCVCLPELVCCHFTRSAKRAPLTGISVPQVQRPQKPAKQKCKKKTARKLWCICKGPEDKDDMVACDNQDCPIVWFHLKCVGLQQATAAEEFWLCSHCSSQTPAMSKT